MLLTNFARASIASAATAAAVSSSGISISRTDAASATDHLSAGRAHLLRGSGHQLISQEQDCHCPACANTDPATAAAADGPAVRSSVESSPSVPAIPRQVFMTTRDKQNMARWEQRNFEKCTRMNPGWRFVVYDDIDMEEYVRATFPGILDTWRFLKNTVEKKDVWSYLIIYDKGGLFLDTDIDCRVPIDRWDQPYGHSSRGLIGVEINKPQEDYLQFTNWCFAFAPRHPILYATIALVLQKIAQLRVTPTNVDSVFLTGPTVFSRAVMDYMAMYGLDRTAVREGGDFQTGDVRLLGVNRFAPLQSHSHATMDCHSPEIFVIHQFSGRWRQEYKWYTADGSRPKGAWVPPAKPAHWRPPCWEDLRETSTL
ncbi:unnamed protein product [Vitrella brassicaformis CCMP3155]|uniref:Alpha 1,4-glycosyltransferase domain-containing protein n=1 Tax=Vitrella brassicaformis (strain CCMP3155) TaxID=1169540 RepID=A0A0G4FC95_VITBC|nr:unnamed protein product [Vitrella brassicaformis CCMP3155]|eukprot:CEM10826.1 unnamed protein product [Vitrella brassicaformis CCMP3155]